MLPRFTGPPPIEGLAGRASARQSCPPKGVGESRIWPRGLLPAVRFSRSSPRTTAALASARAVAAAAAILGAAAVLTRARAVAVAPLVRSTRALAATLTGPAGTTPAAAGGLVVEP